METKLKKVVNTYFMEKISNTLFCMLNDRKLEIMCTHFDDIVTVVNPSLIIIKLEELKVGINSIKNIVTYMENYNVNDCIVLYRLVIGILE